MGRTALVAFYALVAFGALAGCEYDQPRPKPPQPPPEPAPFVYPPPLPKDLPQEPAPKGPPARPVKRCKALIELPAFEKPAPGPGTTPRQTYEAAKFCVGRADYMGVWGLFARSARGEADGNLPPTLGEWRYFDRDRFIKLFGMPPLDFEKLPIPEQYALLSLRSHRAHPDLPKVFSDSTFVSESVDGEAAEVTYRRPDGTTTVIKLVREDGVWKLARTRF